ncbi:MAG: anti-sigma factor domain-containing protein, partial [Solirubrobacteraceae bacterium]
MRPHGGEHDRSADAAAYAVGALEAAEAEEFRRHLDRCSDCRDELAALRRVADALAMAAPQYPAPPCLRRRVLRAVHAAPRSRTRSFPAIRRLQVGLAVAAGLVIVIASIGAIRLLAGRSEGPRVLPARVASSSGTAALRISGGHAELIVRHLPAPPPGRIYEVWLERGHQAPAPTTALFTVTAGGAADIGVPGDLRGVGEVLVTQEPAGGSRVPTGRT